MHIAWGACSPHTHAHTDTNALRQLITRRLLSMTLGQLLPGWLAFYCCVSKFSSSTHTPEVLGTFKIANNFLLTHWNSHKNFKLFYCRWQVSTTTAVKIFHYFWSNILRIWHRWKFLKLHFFVIPCRSPFRQLCSIATLLLNKYIG